MVEADINRYKTDYPGYNDVTKGVRELWTMPEIVQADILIKAMERFDTTRNMGLMALGYTNLRAEDLVRKGNNYYGSRLSDKDVLTCLIMGNLDVYPLIAIHRRNLQQDGLDCSIWDGEFGPGNYWRQAGSGNFAMVNPRDEYTVGKMWKGPYQIDRVAKVKTEMKEINVDFLDPDSGCFVLRPNVAYLHGYWPAISLNGLNVSLETRSTWGRFALAGAVNSITVHDGWRGVLTAEATTFTATPMVIGTDEFPYQMRFEYLNETLNGHSVSRFGSDRKITLEQAAKNYQENPTMMLPKLKQSSNIKRQ